MLYRRMGLKGNTKYNPEVSHRSTIVDDFKNKLYRKQRKFTRNSGSSSTKDSNLLGKWYGKASQIRAEGVFQLCIELGAREWFMGKC